MRAVPEWVRQHDPQTGQSTDRKTRLRDHCYKEARVTGLKLLSWLTAKPEDQAGAGRAAGTAPVLSCGRFGQDEDGFVDRWGPNEEACS
ncbi:hypothetical protein [Streptomyces hoynatensis]|uniref:Uncharacterized protein n=1 Tax=Streptomyces hoynatensis TaxID=1141874 RepID=A0A3A9Z6M3_9ACTN|nr:hypothetical protein [Streptomyces hoynatensis]RKN43955.1 hypothetical protein D7294_09725 [Streptomyces hoynatensis]